MSQANQTLALDAFLTEHTSRESNTNTTVAEFNTAFNNWTAASGKPPVSSKALTQALRARGVNTGRTRHTRFYVGLALSGVTDVDMPPRSLQYFESMTATRTEDAAIKADAKQRLVELIQQRRRLYTDARFDPELRSELDAIDVELRACERELAR